MNVLEFIKVKWTEMLQSLLWQVTIFSLLTNITVLAFGKLIGSRVLIVDQIKQTAG